MPRVWYDRHSLNDIEDEEKRRLYKSILADRKPYFMRYIYPDLMKQYNTYIDSTTRNALREFRMTVDDLKKLPYEKMTERQKEFLRYYEMQMPVGAGDCVMNRICRRFEEEFGTEGRRNISRKEFDYTVMKSDAQYTSLQFNSVRKLYEEYNRSLKDYCLYAYYNRVDDDENSATINGMREQFVQECAALCPNEEVLCNIVLDLCYRKSGTKKFAWDMCGMQIVKNLVKRNGGVIFAPVKNADGDVTYCGERFAVERFNVAAGEVQNVDENRKGADENEYCAE